MKEQGYSYIQNRTKWCWATACKIVGEQYKKNNPLFDFSICDHYTKQLGNVSEWEYKNGVITVDEMGLRKDIISKHKQYYLIDAWQRAIVMNANIEQYMGYDGNAAGDDEAKLRGLRYVVTGDINSDRIVTKSLGNFNSNNSIIEKFREEKFREEMGIVFEKNNYMIGNAVLNPEGICHSFIILGVHKNKLLIHDPWDGREAYYTQQEIFARGAIFSMGVGIY